MHPDPSHAPCVQVNIWATLAAPMCNFYGDSKDDAGGHLHLRLQLRTLLCRARGADVVAARGGIATAIFALLGRGGLPGPSDAHRTLFNVVCDAALHKNSIVPTSNDTLQPESVLS